MFGDEFFGDEFLGAFEGGFGYWRTGTFLGQVRCRAELIYVSSEGWHFTDCSTRGRVVESTTLVRAFIELGKSLMPSYDVSRYVNRCIWRNVFFCKSEVMRP